MTLKTEKSAAVAEFIDVAKQAAAGEVTRSDLDTVLSALIDLASRKQWWSDKDYPAPVEGELQSRYLIHEEPDSTYALYLNVMKPGKKILPHNHTTWACIAAVEGTEKNYLYERRDDGSQRGMAIVEQVGEKPVSPGEGIALLADDIHAVSIEDSSIRHLHMYGLALEKLDQRVAFNTDNDTCFIMPVGVKTKRSA